MRATYLGLWVLYRGSFGLIHIPSPRFIRKEKVMSWQKQRAKKDKIRQRGNHMGKMFHDLPTYQKADYRKQVRVEGYCLWYITKIFTAKELLILNAIHYFTTYGQKGIDPWMAKITLQGLAEYLGTPSSALSTPMKKLEETPMVCPLCDKDLGVGVINRIRVGRAFKWINVKPLHVIYDHIQSHYEKDPKVYLVLKKEWLESLKDTNRVERTDADIPKKKVQKSNILYFKQAGN